jgi:hypothetical protein
LLFTLAERVGSLCAIDLHTATASATFIELGEVGTGTEALVGVVVVAVVDALLADVELLVTDALVAVELEPLPPQPASSAPASNARRSGNRVAIIGPPWD